MTFAEGTLLAEWKARVHSACGVAPPPDLLPIPVELEGGPVEGVREVALDGILAVSRAIDGHSFALSSQNEYL